MATRVGAGLMGAKRLDRIWSMKGNRFVVSEKNRSAWVEK